MLTLRIIPCLDVRDGRVVKGVKFQNLRDAGDPAEQAALYEQQGADEICILDVSATIEERAHQVPTVNAVRRRVGIPLTAGGGVREVIDAMALLRGGADKVSVNSVAVARPALLSELADRFGRQCVVLAIDASREAGTTPRWVVRTHSGTTKAPLDVVEWAARGEELGAGEILLTSWDRDGTREGYDLDLLRAVRAAVNVPIIASGGADSAKHMAEAVRAGADAVLAASIFHDGDTTVASVKHELAALGIEVRR
jgi:imidazole glycerol-phosphate synthase subunit HisF